MFEHEEEHEDEIDKKKKKNKETEVEIKVERKEECRVVRLLMESKSFFSDSSNSSCSFPSYSLGGQEDITVMEMLQGKSKKIERQKHQTDVR
ncbi:hypothetical protein EYF80_062394 [Liparis tanakae]|uniref:Uncharacterized protein n=1 Tax=Liparis tanakae TaxID=230148 RepID=A0A4Z2EFD3_9TELE|nr:hypothetical protein EYF80_062394 [Liparis tanakae]